MTDNVLITYVTCPDAGVAERIARALIAAHEAACVTILPGLRSIYRWQGEVEIEAQTLLLVKTTATRFDAVRERVLSLHPDELPEVVAVPVTHALPAYLDWVRDETIPQ